MREWRLKPDDPLTLTLAADARLGPMDYCDDQIWELSLGEGEPQALALQTTYGLRAVALRLFPRFLEGEEAVTNPASFAKPPVLTHFYPNFLALACAPFEGIEVVLEYWAPESHAVAGRLSVSNRSSRQRQIRLEWVGQLTPTEGERLAAGEMSAAPVLAGRTGELSPVIFMTGGPEPGASSYPSLNVTLDLPHSAIRQLIWTHAARPELADSFALARRTAARRWDAERARLEMSNAGRVDIYTGEPEWDITFALAQKQALSLIAGPSTSLPNLSFVLARQPDLGYSLRGDGTDYNHLWNGQTPLDAYTLAGELLPEHAPLAEGLLANFLAVQAENGFIDWKPGLAGQRSRLLATPLLASLAWRIYQQNSHLEFLRQSFPGLLQFVQGWFSPAHDRDGDGVPEWDHSLQSGNEDHPLYAHWHSWGRGVEINTAESVGLCALLYQECQVLERIAGLVGRATEGAALHAHAEKLRLAVDASWDPEEAIYHDWDRDTHLSPPGEYLGSRTGPGILPIQREFEQPVRLQVVVDTHGETLRRPQIFVHGTGVAGYHRVEPLSEDSFKWHMGRGTLTGQRVYTGLEQVELQNLTPTDEVSLYVTGYRAMDQALLLPLWAGIPDASQARLLVEHNITNPLRFWRPFGLPALAYDPNQPVLEWETVHFPWNALIGEGLLRYGFQSEAAELVARLMAGLLPNLKQDRAFRRYYHSDTGAGIGERNALDGLAPLRLFLDTLGVRLISARRVELNGFNPFPWPVTVKYRGLTVLRQKDKSVVIFPDGQTVTVDDPAPKIVALE